MKKFVSRMAVCAGLCALAAMGGVMMSYADTAETETAQEERERPQDDGSVSAKISSVGSSSIVVYLEERQEPPADGTAPEDGTAPAEGETPPEKPDGETESTDTATPPEKPADGTEPPELPEGETAAADGTTPPEGGMGGGMGHGGMNATYSEETTTITVNSSTTVTEGFEQTAISLSSLEEGDVVRIVLDEDGTTAVSIQLMDMQEPPETAAE